MADILRVKGHKAVRAEGSRKMPRESSKNLLGVGLYHPSEAAFYARVHPATMARWIHGNRMGAPIVHAQLRDDPERVVTFLDFVQALAIRAIRGQYKVSLQKIRAAVEHTRKKYGVEHPLALPHKTFLFGKEIVIEVGAETLIQVSGRNLDQQVLREVAELYMTDLTFDEAGPGLAVAYRAFSYGEREIVMQPCRRLGQPVVSSCAYTAPALFHAYETEGSIRAAADAYGVDTKDVALAIRYFDHLRGTAAA